MASGAVKFWNLEFGRGVLSQDGGDDVPAHYLALVNVSADQLWPGRRVEYSVEFDSEGNPKAVDVRAEVEQGQKFAVAYFRDRAGHYRELMRNSDNLSEKSRYCDFADLLDQEAAHLEKGS